MALRAGRVGVNPTDVNPIDGHVDVTSVNSVKLRVNPDDTEKIQYKTPDTDEWQDFSTGGSGAILLYENSTDVTFPNFNATLDFMRSTYNFLLLGVKWKNETQDITYVSIPNITGSTPIIVVELDRLRWVSEFSFTINDTSITHDYEGGNSNSIIIKEIRGINI